MGIAPVEGTTALGESYSPGVASAEKARSRLRAWITTLPLAMVFAVSLELTCRIEDWVMYRTPLFSRYTSISDLVVRAPDGMHGRPDARFQKWIMDSLGLRGPEASVTPAPGTVRVITVGASETFGLRESPGREYPRQLQDTLNARVGRGACGDGPSSHFEVLNAGFAGMALPTIDQDIRLRLRRYRPAVIVVYPTPAQYLDEEIPFPAQADSSGPKPIPLWRSLFPRAFGRVREQIKVLLPEFVKARMRQYQTRQMIRAHPAGWRFNALPMDRLALYDRDLRKLIGTIRQEGATPVLATHGNMFMGRASVDSLALISWEKFYPRATGETIVAFDSAAKAVTLRVGADSGVVTMDAATRLAGVPVEAFGDFVHFTDLGSSHMADLLGNGILTVARQRGWCGAGASAQ